MASKRGKIRLDPSAADWQTRLPQLAEQHQHFVWLDSHHHQDPYGRFEWLCAWQARRKLSSNQNSIASLLEWHQKEPDWAFGHLSYDLKNELEALQSQQPAQFGWPNLAFFTPEHLVYQDQQGLWLESYSLQSQEDLIAVLPQGVALKPEALHFEPKLSKADYLNKVEQLLAELQYGNIYEINFCLELARTGKIDSTAVFQRLNSIHQAPFSALYRHQDLELLCFSPERYLQKQGKRLVSQPIKGTAARSLNPLEDQELKEALYASEKERAENVMIVDLVRNDLSRVAQKNSVQVKNLFAIESYEAVHQMVSTVQAELREELPWTAPLAHSFPMGSMTGAPKYSAMNLIDQHEHFRRELYAGSVGYLSPSGDYDFNVVIRSILYHRQKQMARLRVGSAITIHCDPEAEYRECLLKAEKLQSLADH